MRGLFEVAVVVVVVVVVRRLFDRRVEQVIYIPFLRATKHRLRRWNDRDTVLSEPYKLSNLVTG